MTERFNPELRGGGTSWAILGATVLALETRRETLSNAAARGFNHESRAVRAACLGLYTLTAAHLIDAIPEQYDPIDHLANGIQHLKDRFSDGV